MRLSLSERVIRISPPYIFYIKIYLQELGISILGISLMIEFFSMKIPLLLSLFLSASVHAFSCYDWQPIQQKPIQFGKERISLTRQYQRSHYGINSKSIEIEPKMIVLHWTCIAKLDVTFRVFDSSAFPELSPRRSELPDDLNVSSHFLVDRDGTIYQLMPETWMARHVIGLNHYAIGIENIGGIDGKDDLTDEQAKANAFLVCYLKIS